MTRDLTRIGQLIVRPGADREHLWIDGAELDASEVRGLHVELTRFLADQPAPTSPPPTTDERSA